MRQTFHTFNIGTRGLNLKLGWLRKSLKAVLICEAFQALTCLSLVNAWKASRIKTTHTPNDSGQANVVWTKITGSNN